MRVSSENFLPLVLIHLRTSAQFFSFTKVNSVNLYTDEEIYLYKAAQQAWSRSHLELGCNEGRCHSGPCEGWEAVTAVCLSELRCNAAHHMNK